MSDAGTPGDQGRIAEGGPRLREIRGPVLVGVVPGQPAVVLQQAAALARGLGLGLVCAYVDVTRYLVPTREDETGGSRPIDPDGVDDDAEVIAATVRDGIAAELNGSGQQWSFRILAGEPARALGRLADEEGASLIVVGTREGGVGARLEKLLRGSVAVHLTHRQHRPVLVVPLAPHYRPEAAS